MSHYVDTINKCFKTFSSRLIDASQIIFNSRKGKMNEYCKNFPESKNLIELFEGEWISRLPSPFESYKTGDNELFQDPRIQWMIDRADKVDGKRVLELGPLEGGHSYTLHQHGAWVTSIEANPKAYLRCLAVKQLFNLERVEFLYGDFMKYLCSNVPLHFDLTLASGVLYHMCNPVELISRLAKCSSQIFIWTHYYDEKICKKNRKLKSQFRERIELDHEGFKHTLYRFDYKCRSGWKHFCGGPASYSNWLKREDILKSCKYFGLDYIDVSFEVADHINGPSFAFIASKKPLKSNRQSL